MSDVDCYLAVDPGGTTGYVIADTQDELRLLERDQLSPMAFVNRAHALLSAVGDKAEVIVERFSITQRTLKLSRQYDAIEITGCLRYFCHAYGSKLIVQTPAEAKRLMTDDRLKALNWWWPGHDHAMDATRHLAYRLAKLQLITVPVL